MFRLAFGVVERMLLRRFCSQTAAAGSQSKQAGARLLHQHVRPSKLQQSPSNVVAAAGTAASRNFGFFRRDHKSQATAILALSTVSVGLGYMSKYLNKSEIQSAEAGVIFKSLRSSEIESVEAGVASKNLRPTEIDWVEAGVVSPVVRNQYECGSCWAMPVIESVEALQYLKTKQSITLSVQELIDCDKTNNGCKSGHCERALKYILENGISAESSYPYVARNSTGGCKLNKTAAARISDFKLVDPTEDALEEAVAKQPVIVQLQWPDDMDSYQGGVAEYEAPNGNAVHWEWHFVLIVGYGTTADGIKYWRFKNSWGETWGEGGFGRIRRHVADERGVLGMFTRSALYPVLNM